VLFQAVEKLENQSSRRCDQEKHGLKNSFLM